jgi:uncharacterized membrane protein
MRARAISLWVMAILYVVAGVMHFARTGFYLQIMPPYIPWHRVMVYVSGVAEMGLGMALLVPRLSRLAAWGLIALLVAVYPANIYMWTADVHIDGEATPGWFHAVRLPAQALLIAWAYWHTRPAKVAAPAAR